MLYFLLQCKSRRFSNRLNLRRERKKKQRKKSKQVLNKKINALLKTFDLIRMELESQSSNDPNCDERVLNLEFGYQQLIIIKDKE